MAPFLAKVKTLFASSKPKATAPTDAAAEAPASEAPAANASSTPTTTVTPPTPLLTTSPALPMAPTTALDPLTTKVIFVLGGPGAGKGTQCARLVSDLHFAHLSAGDLLRAEQQRPESEYGALIKDYIKEGKIVPMEVTLKLLENAMLDVVAKGEKGDVKTFLIDGFPRQMDQAVKFDESVCLSSMVLFLVCPEDKLVERLLKRGETSGRDDDNIESIKKRLQTFIATSMPVVDYYRKQGKVVDIDSSKSVEDVHAEIIKGMESIIPGIATKSA